MDILFIVLIIVFIVATIIGKVHANSICNKYKPEISTGELINMMDKDQKKEFYDCMMRGEVYEAMITETGQVIRFKPR